MGNERGGDDRAAPEHARESRVFGISYVLLQHLLADIGDEE